MYDSNLLSGSGALPVADESPRALVATALLDKVAAEHDAMQQSLEDLRADPGSSAQLLSDLTRMLADHHHYLSERTPREWTLHHNQRSVTIEDNHSEITLILQYLRDLEPNSLEFRHSLHELIDAISWHILAEEETLFRAAS